MGQTILHKNHNEMETGFGHWLKTLGHAEQTVKSLPMYLHEMLLWLEGKGISEPRLLRPEHVHAYLYYFKRRRNKRTGAGLSSSHINKGVLALNKFAEYLHKTGEQELKLQLKREEPRYRPRLVYTECQARQLREATYGHSGHILPGALGGRDRAMLAIFYGCGLRRAEGLKLEVKDVDLRHGYINVRHGKGGKPRQVPITGVHVEDLGEYIHHWRGRFLCPKRNGQEPEDRGHLLLNVRGRPVTDDGLYLRLRLLSGHCGLPVPGLHTLRHSIATHLMQRGMEITDIAKFLGHTTTESTQLYTHISHAL